MGELPSQQPPDWWNMSGPCFARSRSMRATAASVAITRLTVGMGTPVPSPGPPPAADPGREGRELEEPQRLRRVADEQVLGLLVVVQHHPVRLPADARLLVAAEGGVRRVQVVAVGPDAARL